MFIINSEYFNIFDNMKNFKLWHFYRNYCAIYASDINTFSLRIKYYHDITKEVPFNFFVCLFVCYKKI